MKRYSRVERISPTLAVTEGDRKFLQLYRRYIFGATVPSGGTPAPVGGFGIQAEKHDETAVRSDPEITHPRVTPSPVIRAAGKPRGGFIGQA